MMRILSTLPNEYFEFRTTWESVPRSERTVEYLLKRLTMVETRLSKINEATTVSTDMSALLGKKPSKVKYNNSSSLKPKRDMGKVKCYGCKEFGNFKNKCPNVKSAPSKSSASDSALFGEVLLTSDSGATQHMTKSKDYLVNYTSFNTPKPVTLGHKGVMMAYGEGDIEVESFVNGVCLSHTLKKVCYTPDVVKNLFSVPAAADKGITYHLDRFQCSLVKENTTLVVGERHNGLYKLHLHAVLPSNPEKVLVAEKAEKLKVWHECLSHQSKQYVEKYVKKHKINYIKDEDFCESCVLGKHRRKSFGTRPSVAAKPGDLLHADVCGTMDHDSFSGCRYVLFNDNFSKILKLLLLRTLHAFSPARKNVENIAYFVHIY